MDPAVASLGATVTSYVEDRNAQGAIVESTNVNFDLVTRVFAAI